MDGNRAVAEEALTDRSGEKACRKSMDGWRETVRSAGEDGEITAEVARNHFCESGEFRPGPRRDTLRLIQFSLGLF